MCLIDTSKVSRRLATVNQTLFSATTNKNGKKAVWLRETSHDPFAVATCKGKTIVGHIPRWISEICYAFLGKPGASITCSDAGLCGCRNVLVVAK